MQHPVTFSYKPVIFLKHTPMNFKRLSRHFPELANLEPSERETILLRADQSLSENLSPLMKVRDKLLDLVLIAGVCLILIKFIAPALSISPQANAFIVMLLVLPLYFYMQKKRYISQLRRQLKQHP